MSVSVWRAEVMKAHDDAAANAAAFRACRAIDIRA